MGPGLRRCAWIAAVASSACSTAAGRVPAPASEEGNVTPPPEPPLVAPPAPAEAARRDGPFFVADPEGRPVAIQRGDAPNVRYAALDRPACEAELGRRGVAFVKGEDTPGVLAPVRLRGPLHGVSFHSSLPPAVRQRSSLEIFDCRLVLALDDFSQLLAAHDVVDVTHLSAFRPRKAGGCTKKYLGKQHCAALAVDVAQLRRKDGSTLVVERDFHGKVGRSTCFGDARPTPPSPASDELWGLVCEAARRATFHVILTPNYNAAHKNHLHLEITPDAGWMLVK